MATGNWRFYQKAKSRMISDIDMSSASTIFRVHLYTSGTNASDLTLSTLAAVTNELGTGVGGYTVSGITVSGNAVTQSGSVVTWDLNDVTLTASGADWSQLRFAVIEHSDLPICVVEMSTAGFNVTSGNTLTIQQPASGLFELSGGET